MNSFGSRARAVVSFREAFRFWVKLGFINFGGPTGQIAIMYRELVEMRRWVSEQRFLHALNYCMLLPGPEAQQLAIYIGWLLHGTWGGIVAGAFFVIPSVFILLVLSWIYVAYGNVLWVAALFYGLKPAVVAIVGEAVIRIGRRVLKDWTLVMVAGAAFIAIYLLKLPFPAIVLSAGLIGLLGGRFWPERFSTIKWDAGGGSAGEAGSVISDAHSPAALQKISFGRSFKVFAVCLALWFAPVVMVGLWRGPRDIFFQEGLFFSKTAMVTFGGAYAVLAYIAQMAVYHYGWIKPGQMLDGLGLAESTPGPLIMVTQFVGFLAAYQQAAGLPPLTAGIIGALITTWVTFVPSFLWIFLGAPFIERMRGNVKLSSMLSAITAAVVGVILNLALFFAQHTFFPKEAGPDWFAASLATLLFLGMLRFKMDILTVVGAGSLAGLVYRLGTNI